MPELPDITLYLEALAARVVGARLEAVRIASPFLLRTVEPPVTEAVGRCVVGLERLGKRIAIGFEGELWFVLHLMIAGRLHWYERGAGGRRRAALATFSFDNGALTLTEAGTKRRSSLHVVQGAAALAAQRPDGLEIAGLSAEAFARRLREENHTLKRALTDPSLLSGIGNAYSDEILHRAGLSPLALTRQLDDEAMGRLYTATVAVLEDWTRRLRAEAANAFPERVTAFRDGMAVHGRYGKPCPVCGTAIQRIRYAENETNYCPRCQTDGRILSDRSLARLLKSDWPRTIEELERRRERLHGETSMTQGTQPVHIEPARSDDRAAILALLAASGLPVEDLDGGGAVRFLVARDAGALAGVIAIEPLGPTGLLRSLAVAERFRGRGLGVALTRALEAEAQRSGVTRLVLLTETAPEFFARLGYQRIERATVPEDVRASAEFARLCPASAICMARALT